MALGITAEETVEAPCRGLVGKKADQLWQEGVIVQSLCARHCSQHQPTAANKTNKASALRDLPGSSPATI